MFNGMAVVVSDAVPDEHVADEIKPIPPHPFVAWCERLLRVPSPPVCFVRGAKITTPAFFVMQGKIFTNAAGAAALRNLGVPA